MVPQKDPLGILGEQPKKQADPLGILKKKEVSGVELETGGEAGTSEAPLGLRPAKIQPTIFKEPSVGEDTMLARKLAKEQRAAVATTGVKLPAAPRIIAEEKAAERALAPKLEPKIAKDEQGWLANTVSALDKGFYKNLIGNPIKGLGTVIQYGTEAMTGGRVKEGPVSDALMRFGNWFNNAIDEVTPQDPEFKNSLSDQFAQAFGQVGSIVLTGGLGAGGRGAGIATQAVPSAGRLAPAVAAGKELVSEITSPAAISAGLTMGQAEFDRAKQAGATDDQAFEAFYKNAAVGSILEKVPVMQFFKRFNNATAGGVANYIKTKGVAGITGGLEEATTEVLQQVYANKTAKDIYNTNQDIFEGLTESGGIGFGVGFLLNAMGANAKILRKQGKETEAQLVDAQIKEFESRAEKGSEAPPAPPAPVSQVPVTPEKAPIETIEVEEVARQMQPITDKMAQIEREFENLGYKIDTDYDNEIIISDIEGNEIGEIPETLVPLAAEYETATRKLGEFDDRARERALSKSREVVDVEAVEVKPQISKEDASLLELSLFPKYRVEYFDPTKGEMTHSFFDTKEEGDRFMSSLTDQQKSKGVQAYFQKTTEPSLKVGEVALEAKPELPAAPIEELEKEYRGKSVEELVSLKKELYPAPDIETPMTPEEKLLDRVIADKFSDINKDIVEKRKTAEESPRFTSYEDAQKWIENKSKEYKSRNEFLASKEYKDALPDINALYKVEKADYVDKAKGAMEESGVKIGDRVIYDYITPFGAETYSGQIVERDGVPFVKFDEGQATMSGKKSVRWHKGFVKEEATQAPAAPAEEELPFGEGREIKTRKKRQITNKKRRALNIEIVDNPRGEVLQYFIGDGKVSEKSLANFFESEKQGYRWEKSKEEEKKLRKSLTSKNPKAPSIEELAEKIAGVDRFDRVQDFRNAIEEVLLNHNRAETMADELVRDYDLEFAEMEKAAELEEISKEIEEEAQAFVSQIPPAQQEEILKVLNRFRYNDGFINWRQIGEEIKDGFEPVILELSEPSQKIINDAIKQFEETGRVGRISPEALPAKAGDAARSLAERIRAGKITRKGLQVSTGLDAIWDAALEIVATSLEAGASIADAIQDGIKYIRSTDFYKSATNKKQIEDNFTNQLNEEYAIQEQAAGEISVQPEAGTRGKVEAGVPPTRPKKAPEEGEAEAKEEIEYTPVEREKALLNNLYKAKNIPEDARIGFEKEGLKYQTKSQKEAELVAKTVIDQIGIDEALKFADSFKFDGDVNSLIYAESLNRLAKMEREAKSSKEKQSLAKKFAEVGIQYGIKSQYGGRFNAAINYFYQKSPLGVVLMEDMKRKEEFNKFAKNKEQSWKEAHDIIKAELDALKRELEGKKIEPSIKTSEAKIMAARLKRVALKEKYKKGKGGGLTLTTGGLTKEGIEYVGELVATYIEEGIANVEIIIQRIFLDFKDVTGKNLDEKTANQVEEEVRKKYKETKGKSVLNKIRKKLEKLSKKRQDEVIRKSFNQIIESGGLEYDDFRKIVAEVTGYAELTDQEKVRLEELVTKTNAVERMAEKAREDRTEQSLRDFRKAEMEAGKAARELNQLVWNKPDILKRLTSIMQLSTLGIPALINNPIYNIWNQATLRFPVGLINDLVDRGITLSAQATGTEYQREYNALDTQKEFFKKLGFGTKESVEQLITGLNRQDYIQKEVGGQQIQPLQAAKDWWASFTGKKKLTTAQAWDKAIQATAGVPAEAIARTLNIGDKPQRFAAEGAQAAAFAKSFGLKDLDYKLFIEFPKEEAFRVYKSRGLSDAEAAQKAEYIKDVIIKEGQRATFQQDNLVNTALSAVFNTIFGKGKETGLANLVKTVTVSPYIKIPTNAYWSYYNLVNPEIALLQSFAHGGRAFYLNKSGEKNQAKLALRESRYWLAHSITGMAMKAVVIALVKAAVYNPGSDEEESKREREGKAFFEGQGTVNVDKLNAILAGEDPTQVKNGLLIPNRWFGQWGTVGNAIARKYENMTPEQRKTEADYYDFMLGEIATDVLQEMEQGVFANTSSLLSLLQTGNPNRYLTNTLNMFTNIVHPAAIAQISRAEIPNYTTQKADTFLKELENAMLTRSSFMRELMAKYPPSKISIWGEPIQKQGATIQKLFNITRVNKDMFARPIYDDAKKYNDINFFPPAITSSLNGKQLTVDQTRTLQEFVGQARKARIAPYINDSAVLEGFNVKYSDLSDSEDKKKALNYLYEVGRQDGIERFYNQYKDLKPKEKTEDFLKELQFDLFKTLQKYKQKK